MYEDADIDEAVTEGFYRSCGSAYLYYIIVLKRAGKVAVSQDTKSRYPFVPIPPWTLSKRYTSAKGFFALFKEPELFVYDRMLKRHVARRDAILEELNGRMKHSVMDVTTKVKTLLH